MKVTRPMITINEELCNGCGECVPGCEEGALAIIDGKAKLVNEVFCDGLGACLGHCPTGALKVEMQEVEDFDPDAVTEHLTAQGREVPDHMPTPEELRNAPLPEQAESGAPKAGGCGCPGSAMRNLQPLGAASGSPQKVAGEAATLSHWPIQLRLVPPHAPFLNGADVLLTADCVPVALPTYHTDFLEDKVVLMGCPKFDDQMPYVEKLAAITANSGVKSYTVMIMEVPCCGSFINILSEAFKRAGNSIPIEVVTVSCDGRILNRQNVQL